jgi:hypothetical protein
MTWAGSSSREIKMTEPWGQVEPSGQGEPVEILAARSVVRRLLATPGRETRREIWATGRRPGQSQGIGAGGRVAKEVRESWVGMGSPN